MKERLLDIFEEVEVGNETVEVEIGQVVRAAPKSNPSAVYIRLQFNDRSYKWNAPLEDWDDHDDETDPRWIKE